MRNTKKTVFIVSLILIAIIFIALIVPVYVSNKESYSVEEINHSKTWLSEINDNTKLSEINMPGTHDSATAKVMIPLLSSCQNMNIKNQLEVGIRYLDLRLYVNNKNEILINHNMIPAYKTTGMLPKKLTFKNIFNDLEKFLEKNKSETILITLKQEHSKIEADKLDKLIFDTLSEKQKKLIYASNDTNPKLKEVRGKIYILKRYKPEKNYINGFSINWNEQGEYKNEISELPLKETFEDSTELYIQDAYKLDIDKKIEAFKTTIEKTKNYNMKNSIVINFTSTSGMPRINSNKLINKIKGFEFEDRSTGIVVMDFPTKDLIQKIINANQHLK